MLTLLFSLESILAIKQEITVYYVVLIYEGLPTLLLFSFDHRSIDAMSDVNKHFLGDSYRR